MSHGDAVTAVVVMLMFVAMFTWWGWKHILYGIFWPIIKVMFRSIIFIWWTGFIIINLTSPWMYRIWGFNFATMFVPSTKRWFENNFRPNMTWYPNWRVQDGLRPLPADWDGPVQHLWPSWTFWTMVGICIWFWLTTRVKDKTKKKRDDNEVYQDFADIIRPEPDMPRQSPLGEVGNILANTIDVTPRQQPKRAQAIDDDFVSALKGLGYKMADIRRVAPKCMVGTLEERVRTALKFLSIARDTA